MGTLLESGPEGRESRYASEAHSPPSLHNRGEEKHIEFVPETLKWLPHSRERVYVCVCLRRGWIWRLAVGLVLMITL